MLSCALHYNKFPAYLSHAIIPNNTNPFQSHSIIIPTLRSRSFSSRSFCMFKVYISPPNVFLPFTQLILPFTQLICKKFCISPHTHAHSLSFGTFCIISLKLQVCGGVWHNSISKVGVYVYVMYCSRPYHLFWALGDRLVKSTILFIKI